MRAWLIDSFDGLTGLRRAEVAAPFPAPGEALLDVHFAALNPADRYLALGQYPAKPPLPHVLGRDAMGTVAAVGPGVSDIKVGDRKVVLRGESGVSRWGTFADQLVVSADALVDVPPNWTQPQAASAALVYLTAHQALTQWGDLPPSLVLITGASGGVGMASLQLARAMGHTVVGLSRGPAKKQSLLDRGAAAVFDPADPAWRQQFKAALNNRRVGLAIDNIGGPLFSEVIDTLGEGGRISVVGRLAGPVPQFNTSALLFRRLRIGGVAVGAYTPSQSRAAWQMIVATLDRARVTPLIDKIFTFEELPRAFDRLAEGPLGKVVLRVGPDVK